MSSTYNLPFVRWGLRGESDLMSCTAMEAMTTLAYRRMIESNWQRLDGETSDLPPHKYRQTGFKDGYDASKFCGDYADGNQIAYATAVCYSIKIPGDALAGTTAKIEQVAATLYGDRWTSCGAVLAAILTSSPTPPAWADVLAATYSSPDPVTAVDDVDPTWQAPLRKVVRSNTTATGDPLKPDTSCDAVIAVGVDATAYLHIVLRLGDYIPTYMAWIEGGAMLLGSTLAVTFDRAVPADSLDVLVAFHHDFDRTVNNSLMGPHNYDIDLSIRMHRKADALTGIKHYRSLLEQRLWPHSVLNSIMADGNGHVTNPCWVRLITGPNQLGNAGFFKEPTMTYAPYAMSWIIYGRSVLGSGKTVDGISFPGASIREPTNGMTLRLSVFGAVCGYSVTHVLNPNAENEKHLSFPPWTISFSSVLDKRIFLGVGDADLKFLSLGRFSSQYENEYPQNFEMLNNNSIGATVPLTLLAAVDVVSEIPDTQIIKFKMPWAVPDYAIFFCSLAVKDVSDDYAVNKDTNDVVQWRPRDFHLHVV